ncbi:NTP transferase domain-containing protein [Acidicapsa dinghuensis]|uniref:NTP transferase domain-containing protein n=1 Tax=Acidicapsa dinghuensis TaxID=2218256 RepID=A0ABW1EPC8_9BACT|nr:nucleotidyltransferase family protein [Acidicapsa dinghuensis]
MPTIILAAGASRRLGQPKQLLSTRGETLLGRTLRIVQEAGADPIFVVLGANSESIASTLDLSAARVISNPEWGRGISTSIRAGVSALVKTEPRSRAVLMLVCDQPNLSSQHLQQLTAAYDAGDGQTIVASHYGGTEGIPAIFPAALFADLQALSGDNGARQLLRTSDLQVVAVPFPNGEIDIDTPEDLRRLLDT